jgi:hypothetical protein
MDHPTKRIGKFHRTVIGGGAMEQHRRGIRSGHASCTRSERDLKWSVALHANVLDEVPAHAQLLFAHNPGLLTPAAGPVPQPSPAGNRHNLLLRKLSQDGLDRRWLVARHPSLYRVFMSGEDHIQQR